jgi:Leucine-rich repeat (LRR) protein
VIQTHSIPPKKASSKHYWILDGYMIMNKFDLDMPEEASCVVIRNHMINDVFEDDMAYFKNLTEFDLKDNHQIPMHKLRHLPSLEKLDLSFNKLEELTLYEEEDAQIQ